MDESNQDKRLAERLRALRGERGWSLDQLAVHSDVSRATLSRMEKGEVSPTATVLGRLCAAYGMTMSRLMAMVEENYSPLICRDDQVVWNDKKTGFERRSVSPPSESLNCEVLECRLDPGAEISYSGFSKNNWPKGGLEHHLIMREGALEITIETHTYQLQPGDCLRYKLQGVNCFRADKHSGASYTLVIL
ncbi:helix-turn-helix domain-containing protein [Kiloniella sp. EL199]|uniref:helix-turn-helix domain-containing protein n=1 Tax=Kiloniella sp. EL199 TaxID=2107581 RepID=UPI000EA3ACA1|nr:XRE family transcriptional regulator [Kiloniella sp. EL199]